MVNERQRALNAKRAEAQRLLTRVQAKTNRLRRERGVEIGGSQFDVRVSRETLKRARSRDIDRHLERFRGFLDRRTQFTGGIGGTPLPLASVQRLKALEEKYTARGNAVMDSIGDLEAPFTGMSIRERDKNMRPSVKAGGEPVNRTFEAVDTDTRNITSIRALDKLIDRMENRNAPGYMESRIKEAREQIGQIFDRIGQSEMRSRVENLTDEQFFVYWEYGPYANDFGVQYDIIKKQQEGNASKSDIASLDATNQELRESLDWAENLPQNIDAGKREAQARTRNPVKKRR